MKSDSPELVVAGLSARGQYVNKSISFPEHVVQETLLTLSLTQFISMIRIGTIMRAVAGKNRDRVLKRIPDKYCG
jgi:hypothetical protein